MRHGVVRGVVFGLLGIIYMVLGLGFTSSFAGGARYYIAVSDFSVYMIVLVSIIFCILSLVDDKFHGNKRGAAKFCAENTSLLAAPLMLVVLLFHYLPGLDCDVQGLARLIGRMMVVFGGVFLSLGIGRLYQEFPDA